MLQILGFFSKFFFKSLYYSKNYWNVAHLFLTFRMCLWYFAISSRIPRLPQPYMSQWASSVLTHSDKHFCCIGAVWLLIWRLAENRYSPDWTQRGVEHFLHHWKGLAVRLPQCTSWQAQHYGTWPESLNDTWLPRLQGFTLRAAR